jgi:hypothetical protein
MGFVLLPSRSSTEAAQSGRVTRRPITSSALVVVDRTSAHRGRVECIRQSNVAEPWRACEVGDADACVFDHRRPYVLAIASAPQGRHATGIPGVRSARPVGGDFLRAPMRSAA